MPELSNTGTPLIGERIVVVGSSSTGKSTFAEQLAFLIDGNHIELDALFWLPNWQTPEIEDFRAKITAAVEQGPRWITSGNYTARGAPEIAWAQGDTVIWLDLPLRTTLPRLLRRVWRRWRDKELLWGTNRERFWAHFKLWSEDSLVGLAIRRHRRNRRHFIEMLADPRYPHLRRHHLRSPAEIARFLEQVEQEVARA